LRVPEDIAVIGVDNDELLCNLSSPLLSSIEHGAARLGYEAAGLLDRIMQGEKNVHPSHFVVDPQGVIIRRSTEILAIDEPKVAQAMAYITLHCLDRIKVEDVVRAVGVSRSGLEIRFKSVLGYTIRNAIRQVQMERARQSVSQTKLPLKQVAAELGFRSVQHMTTLFRKAFGQPPAMYREKNANHGF
jgi:LacI family transcriptional regulator